MGNTPINYSKVVGDEDPEGETPVYRSAWLEEGEDLVDSLDDGQVKDLKTMIDRAFEKFAENPCLGTRERLNEEGEEVSYGEYKYRTYNEVKEISLNLAKALVANDMCPKGQTINLKELNPAFKNEEGADKDREFRTMGVYSK